MLLQSPLPTMIFSWPKTSMYLLYSVEFKLLDRSIFFFSIWSRFSWILLKLLHSVWMLFISNGTIRCILSCNIISFIRLPQIPRWQWSFSSTLRALYQDFSYIYYFTSYICALCLSQLEDKIFEGRYTLFSIFIYVEVLTRVTWCLIVHGKSSINSHYIN